jgi:glycerol-3-phosphate dehydrogenase (NAD+)
MYVYEEIVEGEKLSEIINTKHENVKYLPGYLLPSNIIAVTDVIETSHDADILIFVLPHQFILNICKQLLGKIKENSFSVSLCKVFILNSFFLN